MKTYLEFHDGSSNKFWQIEVQEQQHTVTYGKVDTSGQSKAKTFESAAECLKDAEKLIKSKKAKGYAELGEDAIIPEKKAKLSSSSTTNIDKTAKQEALDALDQLVRTGKIEDVIPFIQQYAEGNSTALKKALSQAKRFWCDYQDLSKTPEYIDRNNRYSEWGRRGKERHQDITHLLAFGLMTGSDPKSTWNLLHYISQYQSNPEFKHVIKTLKPDWLGDYLKERIIANEWLIEYELLRQLEADQLITFDPQLFGLAVPKFRHYDSKGQRITAKTIIAQYLEDDEMVKRDIPLMFEYETRPQDQWFGKWDNKLTPWHDIFITLIQQNKIERQFALQKIIEMQSKDWNIQTKSFFKKIFADLNTPAEELLQLQDHLFVLLHSEFSASVGFALENIKAIYQHPEFRLKEYLEWLEPLMMRSDLKSQVKIILLQLQNLLKDQPAYRQQMLLLLADVFLQNDLNLQERSAKLLFKYQDEANEEIQAKVAMYQDNLLGDVKSQLTGYLSAEPQQDPEDTFSFNSSLSTYHYQAPEPDYLNPSQKVELIDSWEDLLFFMGQLPHSKNPLDCDIFLSSWLKLRDQRPNDYKQQLEPILKSFNKVQSNATYKTLLQNYFTLYISEETDQWNDNFQRQQINEHKILRTWIELLNYFSSLDLDGLSLPLLSLPTHAPSYIDPEVLVQRIIAFEAQQICTNFADLALALARTPRQNTEKAIALAEKIQGQWIKDIVLFTLGATPLPDLIPPHYPELTDKNELQEWSGLWKTAILSHYPHVTISAIDARYHVEITEPTILPYVYRPRKEYIWDEKSRQYINTPVGEYIKFPLEAYKNSAFADLYHHQAYELSQDNYYGWDYSTAFANGTLFRHLSPLNTAYADLHLASNHCQSADRFSESGADVMTMMMNENYILNPYALFILATHLFSANKEARLYAIETFNHAIYQSKVDIMVFSNHLAQIITHQFAPFSRLVESLSMIKAASPLHGNALLYIIENIIPQLQFTDKLPTQFKKFIELYYLIKSDQNMPVAEPIQHQLRIWQEQSASLKPLVNKLLKGK